MLIVRILNDTAAAAAHYGIPFDNNGITKHVYRIDPSLCKLIVSDLIGSVSHRLAVVFIGIPEVIPIEVGFHASLYNIRLTRAINV